MRLISAISSAIERLASPLPVNEKVRLFRAVLAQPSAMRPEKPKPHRVAIQSVEDPFYFALFGAIVKQLSDSQGVNGELVVVRATNGAIGVGLRAWVMRSVPMTWLVTSKWVHAYAGLIDHIAFRSNSWKQPAHNVLDWFRSVGVWLGLRKHRGNLALTVRGVEVGDLIADTYLRFRPSPHFDASDPFVIRLLWQAHCAVRRARAYFHDMPPQLYLTSYSTYVEHGVPVRVALQAGVRVHSFGSLSRFDKELSLADWYHTANCDAYRTTFESLDSQERRLAQAEERLKSRLSGGIDPATSYMKVSAYTASAVAVPDDVAGAVVVFLHDFYDSPHIYPDLVFSDFWAWAGFTIETLSQAGRRFFLKPHPNQVELSSTALDQLKAAYPQVRFLPTQITNSQLVKAGIACGVTVYGTVAHELAYLGVPTIACARHPHIAFDFCCTAETVDQYRNYLQSACSLPFNAAEMRRQALVFYYMHNLHGGPEELALRSHFTSLWKVCQDPEATSDELVACISKLRQSLSFHQRVQELLEPLHAKP